MTPGVAGSGLGPGDDQADGDEGESQRHLRPAEPGQATRQGGQIRPQRDAPDDPVQAGSDAAARIQVGTYAQGPETGWEIWV